MVHLALWWKDDMCVSHLEFQEKGYRNYTLHFLVLPSLHIKIQEKQTIRKSILSIQDYDFPQEKQTQLYPPNKISIQTHKRT